MHPDDDSARGASPHELGCNRDQLFELVYTELHRLATAKMTAEPRNHTLQPTALVHEAYLRLVKEQGAAWENRAHFFSAAAEAMRRILIERARRVRALKHGGGRSRVPMDEFQLPGEEPDVDVEALSEALEQLAERDARAAGVVKLRHFAGLTIEETAEILDISPRTVRNDWVVGKAWLRQQILGGDGNSR